MPEVDTPPVIQKPTTPVVSGSATATNDNSKAQIISSQKTGWSAVVANKPAITTPSTTTEKNTNTTAQQQQQQPESSFAIAETATITSSTPNPTTVAAYTHQASVLQQYLQIKDIQLAMQTENHRIKIASGDEQYAKLAQHYQEELQKKIQQIESINQQYQAQLQAKDAQIQQLLLALMARNKEREQSY
eukprot:UN03311